MDDNGHIDEAEPQPFPPNNNDNNTKQLTELEDKTITQDENDDDSDTGLQGLTQMTPYVPRNNNKTTSPKYNLIETITTNSDNHKTLPTDNQPPNSQFHTTNDNTTPNEQTDNQLLYDENDNRTEQPNEIDENRLLQDDSDTGLQNLTQMMPNEPQNNTETNTPPNNLQEQMTTDENESNAPPINNQPSDNENMRENESEITLNEQENDNQLDAKQTADIISNIPNHLHAPFQTLISLKHKRNKTLTTIERLTNYKNNDILPDGLQNVTKCNFILDDDHRKQWIQTSTDASKLQLDILLQHHQRTLESIEQQIRDNTQQIYNDNTTNELAKKIIMTTDHVSKKYTTRDLVKNTKRNTNKPHVKRLNKKRNNRGTETITRRLFTTPLPIQQNITNNRQLTTYPSTYIHTGRLNNTSNSTSTATINLDDLIMTDIQREVSNFLTPAHIQTYIQQTTRQNRPK